MSYDLVIKDGMVIDGSDLPAGAKRLKQTADGVRATVVNGDVLLRDNTHNGALPGSLLSGLVPD